MKIALGKNISFTITDSDKTAIHMWLAFSMGIIGYGLILTAPVFILWNHILMDLVYAGTLKHMSFLTALSVSVIITVQMRISAYLAMPKFEMEKKYPKRPENQNEEQ